MDLTEDIRFKLFGIIHGELSKESELRLKEITSRMGDIVGEWVTERISDDVMKISKNSPQQVYYLRSIIFTKETLEIEGIDLFKKSGHYYNRIGIDISERKIPSLDWLKEFQLHPTRFIETAKEQLMFRELQELGIKYFEEAIKVPLFEKKYCIQNYSWYCNNAYSFLLPLGIYSVEDFQQKLPEWYDKYYIPEFLVGAPERPSLLGWDGLVGVLKK